jgi:hypothetical protein
MDDSRKEMVKALIGFQKDIGSIKKTKSNPFFNSKYADLASILEIIRPALEKNGLAIAQQCKVIDSHNVLITELLHVSGFSLESEYILEPVKDDPQSMGSAMTYARRYCLLAILNISPDDDDDDANTASQPTERAQYKSSNTKWQKDKCPVCGEPAYGKSIKGQGYYCFPNSGGCGAQFDKNGKVLKYGKVQPPPSGNGNGKGDSSTQLKAEVAKLSNACSDKERKEHASTFNNILDAIDKNELEAAKRMIKGVDQQIFKSGELFPVE